MEYSYKRLAGLLEDHKNKNVYNVISKLLKSAIVGRHYMVTDFNSPTICLTQRFLDRYHDIYDAYHADPTDIDHNLRLFEKERVIKIIYRFGDDVMYRSLHARNLYRSTESIFIAMVCIHYMKTVLLYGLPIPVLGIDHEERGNEYILKEPLPPPPLPKAPEPSPEKSVHAKYKELMKKFHPDRGGDTQFAQEIVGAYTAKNYALVERIYALYFI